MKGNLKVEEEAGTPNTLKINGGENNIGLYSSGGEILYKGNIEMGGSSLTTAGGDAKGTANIAIFATNNKKITLDGNLKTYNANGISQDMVGVYSDNTTVQLNGVVDIKGIASTGAAATGSTGVYATGANAVINIKTDNSKISINGGTIKKGTGLFAGNGGKIVADGTKASDGLNVTVKDGAAAVAAFDTNSNISLKYATIDYSGDGYALYASSNGKIDVSNATINLRGKSTGFEHDPTNPLISGLNTANIVVYSNDVTIANLRGIPSLNLLGLNASISAQIGGINHKAGVEGGVTYNKYRVAAVDGLSSYNLNKNLDKSLAVDDKNSATDDYIFTRRLAVQRAKVNPY